MAESYVHGYSPAEQRRLTRMQEILNDRQLERLDLHGLRRILDVGAGLGQLTRALARAAGPGAEVVGIERDERQLAEARRQAAAAGEEGLVELRRGEAERLPLADGEWGRFDLAHTRFLLEHVPDPQEVVRQMVLAVRPGGRVVLVDDDHDLLRLVPACPGFERAWRRFWESFYDRGQDPLIGRRLPRLLARAGCRRVRVDTVFYGASRGMELFEPVVDNLAAVVGGAAESLADSDQLPPSELAAALDELEAWRRSKGATVWYSLPLAEGTR